MSIPTIVSRMGERTANVLWLFDTSEVEPFRCMGTTLSSILFALTAQQCGRAHTRLLAQLVTVFAGTCQWVTVPEGNSMLRYPMSGQTTLA
jgi:hypothetical protein